MNNNGEVVEHTHTCTKAESLLYCPCMLSPLPPPFLSVFDGHYLIKRHKAQKNSLKKCKQYYITTIGVKIIKRLPVQHKRVKLLYLNLLED